MVFSFFCENEDMKNKVIEITNDVGKRLKMEFEIDEYTKLIQKDVNNYIAVMKNGKLECKGAMVKFNKPIDNDLPILNDAVRNYLASEFQLNRQSMNVQNISSSKRSLNCLQNTKRFGMAMV